MVEKKSYLGEFEELVLLAILKLGPDAYGMKVRQLIEEVGERHTSIGAIYTTLDRLEEKGFVSSFQGEATAERGGRAKKYFKVEGTGMKALKEVHRVRGKMVLGLDIGLNTI